MKYEDWRTPFLANSTPEDLATRAREAQVWNLENENRAVKVRSQFKRHLAAIQGKHERAGKTAAEAAEDASHQAIEELGQGDGKWLGALPCTPTDGVPTEVVTYLSLEDIIAERLSKTVVDTANPPTTIEIHPANTREDVDGFREPFRRFVWITWAPNTTPLPEDATQLRRELGLSHYSEGDRVYRCRLTVDQANSRLYTPTCFDAGLDPAWKPPPKGTSTPWGLTRDLSTGESRWPELLVETEDYLATAPVAYAVAADPVIGHLDDADFMIGR
jgi:hypothetical protein